MENLLKQLMKEAVLEALNEFVNGGVALAEEDTEPNSDSSKPADKNTIGKEPESGKGGGSEESSGGTPGADGRPKPDVGVGVWSRR